MKNKEGWEMYAFEDKEKSQMCDEIARFFSEEYDLELGIIGTGKILDFFQEMLGDRVYNKALDDAKKFYEKYADNMETDYYALYKDCLFYTNPSQQDKRKCRLRS